RLDPPHSGIYDEDIGTTNTFTNGVKKPYKRSYMLVCRGRILLCVAAGQAIALAGNDLENWLRGQFVGRTRPTLNENPAIAGLPLLSLPRVPVSTGTGGVRVARGRIRPCSPFR